MFDGILKEYDSKKKIIEKENEITKKNLKQLADPLTKDLLVNLNTQVAVLHANQQIIDKETKQLRNECLTFYKEAKGWIGIYDELNESLKQLGDVVHWAKAIENDLQQVVAKKKAQA